MKKIQDELSQDFKDFCDFDKSKSQEPSRSSRETLFATITQDLNPSPYYVFSKLLVIHSFVAVVTLSICPQFGFRVWGDGMGLMRVFMNLGTYGCLIACGAFFTSMSLVAASFILKGEDLRTIRNNRWLTLGSMVSMSLGFFVMLDAEILFGLTTAWLVGAFAGSLLTLEVTWRLRFQSR